jgi:HK97 family phage portal protein
MYIRTEREGEKMSAFTKWLSDLFGASKAKEIESNGYRLTPDGEVPLDLEHIAIQSAVGLIASAIGQCRFRTFMNGEEVMEDEYYLWNYSPNANQNSTQFLQDLVETLVYNNEVLVVEQSHQLFVADSFSYNIRGTKEVVYQNITVNSEHLPDKRASDALYLRMANDDVQPYLSGVCKEYEDIISKALESYEKAGADKGFLNIDSTKRGPIDYEKYQKDLIDNKFKAFFSSKNAVLPLHAGYTYTPATRTVRNTSEINDIKNMSDEIYNRVGQIFRVPPAFLRGEVAQSGEAVDNFLKFCIRPICDMLEEEITRKRYGAKGVKNGSFVQVDPSMVEISGIFASADKLDKIIGCGVLSIDEVRQKVGEVALGTEEAQKHFVTKNYGVVDTTGEEGQNE